MSGSVTSWPAYRFLKRQVRWSAIPTSLRIFQFVVIHTVKGFSLVNEADVFLELSCFSYHPVGVGNLISGSSAFSKFSLNIWKFSVPILLKPNLENFEHYFASMWNECNCEVVWTFLGFPSGSVGKESVRCRRPRSGLEKEMTTHSSILAWRIPWTEELGRPQFMGSQRAGHDCVVNFFVCVANFFEHSLALEWKLTFSSPLATAEFSKFAGILSAAL